MAAIARHKTHMNEHLAVGLASGLCGSLTTFATWMGEEAKTSLNGYTFEAFVSLICMLCVSLCSYKFGHYLAGCGMGDEPRCFDDLCGLRTVASCCFRRARSVQDRSAAQDAERPGCAPETSVHGGVNVESDLRAGLREPGLDRSPEVTEEERAEAEVDALDWGLAMDSRRSWHEDPPAVPMQLRPVVQWFIVLLALLSVIVYVKLCISFKYWEGLFDLAYAPLGALLRWYLSLYNASAQKACFALPVFTLVANTLGCACNAFSALMAPQEPSPIGHIAIAAISTGFAGCLSTVSTLISELRNDTLGGLRMRVGYFLLSVGLAMAVEIPMQSARCAK